MSTPKNCFSGTGKEKSRFAMTCNRLSLFLKEKRSLRGIGIDSTFDVKDTSKTTVDLLSKIESENTKKSITHLPQYDSEDSFCKSDDSTNKVFSPESVAATESKTAQMTIFYRGQVFVFDCVSADKARDMMLAASDAAPSSGNQIQNRIPLASVSNSPHEAFRSQNRSLRRPEVNGLDLPIARRSSLHKFLAKRKDRATERGPYQMPSRLTADSSSDHKFDLNL